MLIDSEARRVDGPLADVLGVAYRVMEELLIQGGTPADVADAMAQKLVTRLEARLAQHSMVVRQI